MSNVVPNDSILRYYFYFIQERMNIFWRKCQEPNAVFWTNDPILRKYKFTNVYRAVDRVSQYLISNVVYDSADQYSNKDLLLRILIFKIFNKIETWEFLVEKANSYLTCDTFNAHYLAALLTERQKSVPIFNNAYMMTGSDAKYVCWPTKHERWLQMVQKEILDEGRLSRILVASSLEQVYNILHECTFIGEFLAYQYAIDMNYSSCFNFNENSFVKAGIGAIRGIKKCFVNYGDTYEDAIRYVQQNFYALQEKYGYPLFKSLPNHEPTLIDLQNCFCETDKYLRAKIPELKVDNIRIKQKFLKHSKPIYYRFPKAWSITTKIEYIPKNESLLFE